MRGALLLKQRKINLSISFFSNFFNAHQLPVARELDAESGIDYAFVAMKRVDGLEGRACLNDDYPFVIKQYLGGSEAKDAMAHAVDDDIVVFGDMAGDESYVRARAKTGKPFFRYSERLLKRGDWWALVPPKRYRTFDRFTRYNDCPMYVLCASGYTARDLGKFGFPVERCLKWGYFPQIESGLMETCMPFRQQDFVLSSAQRLIRLKRVDLQIRMARELKNHNVPFKLYIAGGGEEESLLKELSRELDVDDRVSFVGALSSEDTLALMRNSDVFLATSNRKEGWGATVNEAMAEGCAVVASNQIGSAPFLIDPGVDGQIFRSENADDLANVVASLLSDPERLRVVALNGMKKVNGPWSAKIAAKRLVEASVQLLADGRLVPFEYGPLSVADVIDEDWYLK